MEIKDPVTGEVTQVNEPVAPSSPSSTLVGGTGDTLSPKEEADATALLGKNVVEDKNAEAVRADLSVAKGNPGVRPTPEPEPGSTVQREDGTFTIQGKEDHTAHYIQGSRVMIKDEDADKVKSLTEELNQLQDDRGISDIPASDMYWEKKKELDAFVAKLRR